MSKLSQESNSEGPEHINSQFPIITLSDENKYQLRLYPNNSDSKFILDLKWSSDATIPTIQIGQHQDLLQQQHIDGSSTPDSEECQMSYSKRVKISNDQEQFHNHFSTVISKDTLPLLRLTHSKQPPSDTANPKCLLNESSAQLATDPHDSFDSLLEIPRAPLRTTASSTTVLNTDKNTNGALEARLDKLENVVMDIHNMLQDIHTTYYMKKESECDPQLQLTDHNEGVQPDLETVIHFAQSHSPISSNMYSVPQMPNNCSGIINSMHIDIPDETQVIELKRRSNTRRNFAAKLALRIFTEEGLMLNNSSGKCPEGTIGKLDSTKMQLIKSLVFQHWPVCESEGITEDDFWKQECMRAIDEKGRYLRFQKKSTYKKMLRKRGIDGHTPTDNSQMTLNNLNANSVSLSNFIPHDFCINSSSPNYMTQAANMNDTILSNPTNNPNSLIFSLGGDISSSPSKQNFLHS